MRLQLGERAGLYGPFGGVLREKLRTAPAPSRHIARQIVRQTLLSVIRRSVYLNLWELYQNARFGGPL
jgi:hypothetical protein